MKSILYFFSYEAGDSIAARDRRKAFHGRKQWKQSIPRAVIHCLHRTFDWYSFFHILPRVILKIRAFDGITTY